MARPKKLYSDKGLTQRQIEIRNIAMNDLKAFVRLVAPNRLLGHAHYEMLDFFQYEEEDHQLVLWPRAHQKSAMIAFWTLWHIVNNPDTTVLYASDTTRLAESQLFFIKNIMETEVFRRYWGELINPDEGKRNMWRNNAICVDHWKRTDNLIRDPTIYACGMGTGMTGAHFDVLVLDDIVVYDNSATPEERNKCSTWYSLASSILNPGGIVKAVGTRYHPQDLYQHLIDMTEEVYDDEGEILENKKIYSVSQKVVEEDWNFLWPRSKGPDGKWYGFDRTQLSRKKSEYINKIQFYAQYYNNPNDPDNVPISNFNYYDKEHLSQGSNGWMIGDKKLNVFAAIDFASTISAKSDYTCIVVVGIDSKSNLYVLDIDRFKTDKISIMHNHLTNLYVKWQWIKLRAEATAAQNLVVQQLKEFNRKYNIVYGIEIFKPVQQKEIRIMTNLEPRYAEGTVYHYKGGNCELLEEELQSHRPRHDDIKDALASVIEVVIPPVRRSMNSTVVNISTHPRFGGVGF